MPTMRAIGWIDVCDVQAAIKHLRDARRLLRQSGARRAADYVGRAIKSAEGAERHAAGVANRNHLAQKAAAARP